MENEATNESPEIQTLINTFTEITSSSKSDAVFFLENYNHNLDAAVSAFLDNSSAAVAGKSSDRRDSASEDSKSYSPSNSDDSSSPSPPPPSLRSKRKAQSSNGAYNLRPSRPRKTEGDGGGAGDGGIHTLADLNRRPTRESESDSDEPREYYTGGEKSGMLIQDPSKANDADKIFNQARCNAAMEGPLEHLPSSVSGSFSGTARRLTGEAATSVPQPPENVTYTITFWRNGFTVDGGPLRRFDDPTNASFLESIRKSECPKELEPVDTKTSVHVNLTRRQEKCPVAQKRHTSFQGAGRTLGSTSSATPLESTVLISSLTAAPTPSIGLVVDQTQPSTSIQIRLGDGTRMVSRFNLQHTIRDIRGFIDASRPGGSGSYQLQTVGFPPKELINLDQTIEQAGIANSVVIQKL